MFTVLHVDKTSSARIGRLETAHGSVVTPAFVAVATQATVKALEPATLSQIGVQIVIANTYHLHLRPGEETIAALGGLHEFSGWNGPTMTDSGGFQVFSLGAGKIHGVGKVASIFPEEGVPARKRSRDEKSLVQLTEEGVAVRSIVDGSTHFFSPEGVIASQRKLGSDIMHVLDECTSPLHDYAYTKVAMERTHRWAERALVAFVKGEKDLALPNRNQHLYGIIQGGAFRDLREESARVIGGMKFDGLAIGGSLGRSKEEMHQVLDWVVPLLPKERSRHLLGIGQIDDIFAATRRGIDTFDCAAPTRMARNGTVFAKGMFQHRMNLRNARFRTDLRPIEEACDCFTCCHHSRAYLHHLCRSGELSFYRLASLHNLRFLTRLMQEIRSAIQENRFDELETAWLAPPDCAKDGHR
jgi:queuine tRNA-ribosyltransferase